jgi:hypothetical protein
MIGILSPQLLSLIFPSVLGYFGGKVGNDVKLVSQAGCADRRTE